MTKESSLSTYKRESSVKQLSSQTFDLLVIGGGITGAGIALDAASRGLSIALVDKNDFASGTSSKSTKLIHGGLRYLKQFEIGLVKEVGRERAILHKNAPHVVFSENMLLPIIENGSLGRTSTAIGLSVYDWLAGVRFSEWKDMLTKYATLKKEPLLRKDIVRGGAIYKEYRTDDARLVMEVVKTAAQFGALCLNYAEVKDFIYSQGKVAGADGMDKLSKKDFSIRAKKVINAAGPWVDTLRAKDQSLKGKKLHLTKGIHIVVPYEKLPVRQSAYFDVKDGRMIFVIPRGEITYVGTTDTNYSGSIDHPVATKDDVNY
ncbi:MAG TPA: glycerol-3-phosphate dehydrogenase/oxidase, partial [Candidatus Binatia bacterium]|nr:glycerol-3-phosphate dehydrogenase/oxidase [Candidatus Binatia bacterium]